MEPEFYHKWSPMPFNTLRKRSHGYATLHQAERNLARQCDCVREFRRGKWPTTSPSLKYRYGVRVLDVSWLSFTLPITGSQISLYTWGSLSPCFRQCKSPAPMHGRAGTNCLGDKIADRVWERASRNHAPPTFDRAFAKIRTPRKFVFPVLERLCENLHSRKYRRIRYS